MLKNVLTEEGEFELDAITGLQIAPQDLERATGWAVKPQGLCKGDLCVPMTDSQRTDGRIDAAAFWRRLGNPVLSDEADETWVLGAGATERSDALGSLDAPDFELPDVNGIPRRLSSLRGKKVFLATWASW